MTKAIPSDAAWALGPHFVPRLGFRPRGTAGEQLGPGVGASLEFEDRRHYAPGDDLRHVDWRVMARTEEVLVRVHREEIQPRLDLILDGSRSMASEPEKAQGLVDLAALVHSAAESAGLSLRCFVLADEVVPLSGDELRRHGVHFSGRRSLPESLAHLRARLAPGSLRICLSDFLTEGAFGLQQLAQGAGGIGLVQWLGPWEAAPPVGERARLVDAELGAARDLTLTAPLVAQYQARLDALTEALAGEARRLGMRYARAIGGTDLSRLARETLLPAGILELASA